MAKYAAAIDQGTTSTRFMVFDHSGKVVCFDQKEHEQIYPKPGWVEHDPMEIWTRVDEVVKGGLAKGNIDPADIAAVGITNQRETTVVWNRNTGKPYYNAIVWQDTRTADICNALAADGGQDRFRAQVGLPLATYFSGPKVRWILDNVEGVRAAAEAGDAIFGNIDTWVIWNLTGGTDGGAHVTDVSNASRTMLMNLNTLDWDDEILGIMGVPRAMLPKIVASSAVYGSAKGALAGIPVAGDLGDQQAALFGQTCFSAGEAKNTYGTGCFMLLNTGTTPVPSKSGLLTTLGYKIGDEPAVYALEGSIAITGALVQWLRDNLGLISRSSDVEALAATVEDNGGIYFVPWITPDKTLVFGEGFGIRQDWLDKLGLAMPTNTDELYAVLKAFRDKFGVNLYEGYGLTEAAPVVSCQSPHLPFKPGSVGPPLDGIEVRIRDGYHADIDNWDDSITTPFVLIQKGIIK